jgi:hypothetical protein
MGIFIFLNCLDFQSSAWRFSWTNLTCVTVWAVNLTTNHDVLIEHSGCTWDNCQNLLPMPYSTHSGIVGFKEYLRVFMLKIIISFDSMCLNKAVAQDMAARGNRCIWHGDQFFLHGNRSQWWVQVLTSQICSWISGFLEWWYLNNFSPYF